MLARPTALPAARKLSKISCVTVKVRRGGGTAFSSRVLEPYGTHGFSWVQESGDFKEYTATYEFTPRADGGTDVTVDIVAEVGFFVPGPMKKLIKDQSLKNALRELKKRVES